MQILQKCTQLPCSWKYLNVYDTFYYHFFILSYMGRDGDPEALTLHTVLGSADFSLCHPLPSLLWCVPSPHPSSDPMSSSGSSLSAIRSKMDSSYLCPSQAGRDQRGHTLYRSMGHKPWCTNTEVYISSIFDAARARVLRNFNSSKFKLFAYVCSKPFVQTVPVTGIKFVSTNISTLKSG